MLLGAKLGDLEGKLGHREVMLKRSWAMLCYVEAIGQIFFGNVVGFASRNAFPPAGPRYWVGSCELCLLHLGSSKATLWLRWCHLEANFGDFGANFGKPWNESFRSKPWKFPKQTAKVSEANFYRGYRITAQAQCFVVVRKIRVLDLRVLDCAGSHGGLFSSSTFTLLP